MFQIGLKKFFLLKNLKILCCGYMLLVMLTKKKLLEPFKKKNCKKQIKEFKVEEVIKRKDEMERLQ